MHVSAAAAATPPRVVSTAVSGADVAPPPHVSADAASPPRVVSIAVSATDVHANDDNEDYDIDEQSYAESGTHQQTDKHGDMSYFARGVDGPNENDEDVGDLEFDLDIGYDEYQQETLDRHWEVMAKTFRSEGEAYMFYNQYAKDRGFSIRRT
ncbi:putative LRR receptor-like serine/threonine-protein kinase [Hordeum vulgare]|nr:putative LRR receptor-like serine/threonine-protein kinase [Hordeum vulgare]